MELDEITDIERLYTHGKEEPTLRRPYAALLERWEDGQDDRETCLRLLFLTWYSCCEPWYLTGLPEDPPPAGRFASIFDRLGGEQTDDPEILAAVGLMATSFPTAAATRSSGWRPASAYVSATDSYRLPRSSIRPISKVAEHMGGIWPAWRPPCWRSGRPPERGGLPVRPCKFPCSM